MGICNVKIRPMINIIQKKLQISKEYITKNGVAWMVNPDRGCKIKTLHLKKNEH